MIGDKIISTKLQGEYTTKSGVLTVCEAFNGWYITHNPSHETRGMGDAIPYETIEDIEADESELLAVYFPYADQLTAEYEEGERAYQAWMDAQAAHADVLSRRYAEPD